MQNHNKTTVGIAARLCCALTRRCDRTSPPRGPQQCKTSRHFAVCAGCFVGLHGSLFLKCFSVFHSSPLSVSRCFQRVDAGSAFNQLHHGQTSTNTYSTPKWNVHVVTSKRRNIERGNTQLHLPCGQSSLSVFIMFIIFSCTAKWHYIIPWFTVHSLFMTVSKMGKPCFTDLQTAEDSYIIFLY